MKCLCVVFFFTWLLFQQHANFWGFGVPLSGGTLVFFFTGEQHFSRRQHFSMRATFQWEGKFSAGGQYFSRRVTFLQRRATFQQWRATFEVLADDHGWAHRQMAGQPLIVRLIYCFTPGPATPRRPPQPPFSDILPSIPDFCSTFKKDKIWPPKLGQFRKI